jgi:hypothetical protein
MKNIYALSDKFIEGWLKQTKTEADKGKALAKGRLRRYLTLLGHKGGLAATKSFKK